MTVQAWRHRPCPLPLCELSAVVAVLAQASSSSGDDEAANSPPPPRQCNYYDANLMQDTRLPALGDET